MSLDQLLSNDSSTLNFPTIRPTLDLNFARTKTLDPRITFTRSSGGSYVGPDGIIKYAGVNQPRFDHDPVTGESLGLLIEEQRTNNVLTSSRVDTSWLITVSGGSGIFIDGEKVTSSVLAVDAIYDASLSTSSTFILRNSISGQPYGTLTGLSSGATRTINSQINIGSQNSVSTFLTTETIAPDGSYNACLVTPTKVGSQSRNISKIFTTSTAGTYTFSIFFKNKNITNNLVAIVIQNQTSLSNVVANFNISTKTFSLGQNGGWTGSVGYQDYSNGWTRIWVTATTTTGSHTFISGSLWIGGYQGTSTSVGSLYAWGAQLEQASFPTSYIPTVASTKTRSSDNASMTGTNFNSWYNQSGGTISIACITRSVLNAGNTTDFAIVNSTYKNRIVGWFNINVRPYFVVYANNINIFLPTAGVSGSQGAPNTPIKKAIALATRNMRVATNGIIITGNLGDTTVPNYLPNDFNSLFLGYEGVFAGYLNGTISRLTYYPKSLPNSQLQALTR
jgi:hypothetical protein